jgi:hypothetical protein
MAGGKFTLTVPAIALFSILICIVRRNRSVSILISTFYGFEFNNNLNSFFLFLTHFMRIFCKYLDSLTH